MKKKIIVAGAGHGGVVAASILAEKGFDVTVYEKKKRECIGFDWHDTFRINSLDDAGIPRPPESCCKRSFPLAFTNPAKTVRIAVPDTNDGTNCSVDRKYLAQYLTDYAESKGVKFKFGVEVSGVIAGNDRINGITISEGNKNTAVFADLVIDSAGIDSPVRKLIPNKFMIQNDMPEKSIFTVYRAYFQRIAPENPPKPYTVYLFHMGKPGISWVIAHENYFDVLIGLFGEKLSDEDIKSALQDIKECNPSIGNKLIRGGSIERIPLGRTMPLLVADGYAAIGDCASMTIPIMGSGIANSIRAGKLLADAIIDDPDMLFTAEALWKYQYNYFTKIGNNLVIIDKLRELATQITADDIDYVFEKELLNQQDIILGADGNFNILYILQKAIKALPKLPKLTNAAKLLSRYSSIKNTLDLLPEKYNRQQVIEWIKMYSEI